MECVSIRSHDLLIHSYKSYGVSSDTPLGGQMEDKEKKVYICKNGHVQYHDEIWKRLSDFQPYGKEHTIDIAGKKYRVLPLAHPRQIAQLGRSTQIWFELHQEWLGS